MTTVRFGSIGGILTLLLLIQGCTSPHEPVLEFVDVRDVRLGPHPVYIWDAGGTAPLVLHPEVSRVTARWEGSSSEALVVTKEVIDGATRIEVKLPPDPRQGTLVIDADEWELAIPTELWDSIKTLSSTITPNQRFSKSDAVATAAWSATFKEYYQSNDRVRLKRWLETVLKMARRRKLAYTELRVCLSLVNLLNDEGRVQQATHYLLAARVLAASLPIISIHAAIEYEWSGTQMAAGQFRGAEIAALKAIEIYQKAGQPRGLHYTIDQLALLWTRMGRFQEAERLYADNPVSSELSETIRAHRSANRADCALRLWLRDSVDADFQRGIRLLKRAWKLFTAAKSVGDARSREIELAWWLALRGQADDARSWLGGLEDEDSAPETYGLPELARAQIALLDGRVEDAIERLERTIANPPQRFDRYDAEIEVLGPLILARAYQALGRHEAAATALESAVEEAHRIARRTALSSAQWSLLDRRNSVRQEAIHMLVASGAMERALRIDDRHRSAALVRLKRGTDLTISSTTVRFLRSQLDKILGKGCLPPARGETCTEGAIEIFKAIDTSSRVFEKPFHAGENSFATTLDMPLGGRFKKAEKIWVFTSSVSREGFIVGGDGIIFSPRVDESSLEGIQHLYIVADRLDAFRFAVLRLLPDLLGGRSVPSVSVVPYVGWLAQVPKHAPKQGMVIVADPAGDLPFAEREGLAVFARWPKARLWLNETTQSWDLMEELQQVDTFHFAGHGMLLSADPWMTLLRVGPESVLTLEDWLRNPPRLRLAVLDGCTTGGPSARPGQLGFPQVMLQTGTETVLATTRPVRDGVAAQFLKDFYDAGGRTQPGEAFLAAVRASEQRRDRIWRAFVLWGTP